MIALPRGFPLKIEAKQATVRRFTLGNKKKALIDGEIARDFSGYNGEKMLDFHLRSFTTPDIRIYNDLYFDDRSPFQLDTFLFTPCFTLSIDAKNIDGETEIDPKHDLSIQHNSYGAHKLLPSLIAQAKRHSFLSMQLLQKHHIYGLPIEVLVANCNPTGTLTVNNPTIADIVIDVEKIPQRIEELQKKYTRRILSPSDITKVHNFILAENKPFLIDIEKKYGLLKAQTKKGVHCHDCGHLGMIRKNGFWLCPKCGAKSTTAHERAIRDFFLLVKRTITVSECCDFLGISSRHVAKRLLQGMGLRSVGKNRYCVYLCPWVYK